MNPSNLTVFRVRCELYWSAACTRHVKPLTPHLCFSLDVPSVLLHVTDLKLSNRDSRASLQRTRNVVRNLRRPLCTVDEREAESPRLRFRLRLRMGRSIPNEREHGASEPTTISGERNERRSISHVVPSEIFRSPSGAQFLTSRRRFGAPNNLFAAR